MKIVLAAVPYINTRIPPLSLAILSGHLKKNGYSVRCLDFNIQAYQNAKPELKKYWKLTQGYQWSQRSIFDSILFPQIVEPNLDKWCEAIIAEEPEVLGISVTDSPLAVILSNAVRERAPSIKIVVGGPHCSRAYVEKAFGKVPSVDAVVDGEGEEVLVELLNKLRETGELCAIPGVTIINGGIEKFGGVRPPIKNLDLLGFADFSSFDLTQYTNEDSYGLDEKKLELPIYSSRGCVAKCRFCMDYKMWKSYRFKSAVRFIDELEHIADTYGAKQFFFVELLVNGSHRWLREYASELKRRRRYFAFHSHGRISQSMTKGLLKDLRSVGLLHLNIGLESGSTPVLKKMWKGYDTKEASRCIKDIYAAGISMSINLVVGFPGESTWNWLTTIVFILRHRKFFKRKPNLSICDATAGSDIYLYPDEFNVVIDKNDPQYYMTWKTKDGRNTYRIRKFRRDTMDFIFSRVSFWKPLPGKKEKDSWRKDFYSTYIAQPRKLFAKVSKQR